MNTFEHLTGSPLLHDPICQRMSRYIVMQDPTTPVLDDEETVQHSESRSRHGEEVKSDDGLAVIAKKGQPLSALDDWLRAEKEFLQDEAIDEEAAEMFGQP
jgi:hypothetical protein